MRELQTAHEAASNAAHAQVLGGRVLPARHPAKLNGDGRRADAYFAPALKLERPDAAETRAAPPHRPRPPLRGRRATDRRGGSFPHPTQLKPQAPFMAQLMSQDQVPGAAVRTAGAPAGEATANANGGSGSVATKFAESDLANAQRRHHEQVDAYRRTITMATDFILRRYHLATDFQGLMITDDRAVEMVV